jgi:hypothetical protein
MTKIRNSKPVLVIEYWNLRFVCNLVPGIRYITMLHHSITPADCRKTGTFLVNLTDLDCARSCVILSKALFFGVVGGSDGSAPLVQPTHS